MSGPGEYNPAIHNPAAFSGAGTSSGPLLFNVIPGLAAGAGAGVFSNLLPIGAALPGGILNAAVGDIGKWTAQITPKTPGAALNTGKLGGGPSPS